MQPPSLAADGKHDSEGKPAGFLCDMLRFIETACKPDGSGLTPEVWNSLDERAAKVARHCDEFLAARDAAPRIVFVGSLASGKSTLINQILGTRLMFAPDQSDMPVTVVPVVVSYGTAWSVKACPDSDVRVRFPPVSDERSATERIKTLMEMIRSASSATHEREELIKIRASQVSKRQRTKTMAPPHQEFDLRVSHIDVTAPIEVLKRATLVDTPALVSRDSDSAIVYGIEDMTYQLKCADCIVLCDLRAPSTELMASLASYAPDCACYAVKVNRCTPGEWQERAASFRQRLAPLLQRAEMAIGTGMLARIFPACALASGMLGFMAIASDDLDASFAATVREANAASRRLQVARVYLEKVGPPPPERWLGWLAQRAEGNLVDSAMRIRNVEELRRAMNSIATEGCLRSQRLQVKLIELKSDPEALLASPSYRWSLARIFAHEYAVVKAQRCMALLWRRVIGVFSAQNGETPPGSLTEEQDLTVLLAAAHVNVSEKFGSLVRLGESIQTSIEALPQFERAFNEVQESESRENANKGSKRKKAAARLEESERDSIATNLFHEAEREAVRQLKAFMHHLLNALCEFAGASMLEK